MKLREKYGWPVETIKGRWFVNLIRLAIHTNWIQSWRLRNLPDDLDNCLSDVEASVKQSPLPYSVQKR